MFNTNLLLILVAAFCNVMAQMSLKTLASQTQISLSLQSFYMTVINKFFIIGVLLYLVSLFLSIKIFETEKFSYVVPMFISFVFIITFFVSIFIFNEDVTLYKIFGTFLIIVGIYFAS